MSQDVGTSANSVGNGTAWVGNTQPGPREAEQAFPPQRSSLRSSAPGLTRATAIRVLGITAGVLGILTSLAVLMFGGVLAAIQDGSAGEAVLMALIALALSLLGLVGGVIAHDRPGLASGFLLAAAGLGFWAVYKGWLLAGPMFLAAGILALSVWAARRRWVAADRPSW